jgi:L-fuculose-phosphate aldolase
VRKYIKAHDGMLLANHGALTLGATCSRAYYKMETIEHFAKISLVRAAARRENCCRARRSSGCRAARQLRHPAPAPICPIRRLSPTVEAPARAPARRRRRR